MQQYLLNESSNTLAVSLIFLQKYNDGGIIEWLKGWVVDLYSYVVPWIWVSVKLKGLEVENDIVPVMITWDTQENNWPNDNYKLSLSKWLWRWRENVVTVRAKNVPASILRWFIVNLYSYI